MHPSIPPTAARVADPVTRIAVRRKLFTDTNAWVVIDNFPVAALGHPDSEAAALNRLPYNLGFVSAPVVLDAIAGFAAGCSTWSDYDTSEQPCPCDDYRCFSDTHRDHVAAEHRDCQHVLFGTDPGAVSIAHLATTSTGLRPCICDDVEVQDDDTLPHHRAVDQQFADGRLLPEHRPWYGHWWQVLDPATLVAAAALEQWVLRTGPYGHQEYAAKVTRSTSEPELFQLSVTADDGGPLRDLTTEHDTAEQARIHGALAIRTVLTGGAEKLR